MDNKYTGIKQRVLQIAENKGIAKERFFNEIGMTYGNFKVKSKNTPLNSNAIANIFSKFPDINLEWLLTGEGTMLKEQHNVSLEINGKEDHEAAKKVASLLQDQIKVLEDYIEILKENRELQKRVISYLEKELEVKSISLGNPCNDNT